MRVELFYEKGDAESLNQIYEREKTIAVLSTEKEVLAANMSELQKHVTP